MEIRVCGVLASTENVKLPTDTRRLRCPGGHARDSARRLAPLLPSGFHARILLDVSVFFHGMHGSPPGAPCIFGSIQQAGAAVYAPEASFWASEILRQTIWVGGRGPARQYHAFRVAPGPKMTPIARLPRFAASPTGTAMLNTPVFARSKQGYVGTGRGAPVFLCMTQAKLCKTIGHHAPDTQIGGDMRRDTGSGASPGIATRVTKL